MKTRLFKLEYGLIWLAYSLILGSCYITLSSYKPLIIEHLAGGSIAVFLIVGMIGGVRLWLTTEGAASPWLNWSANRLLTGLTLAAVSFTLAAGAINKLPPPLVTQSSLLWVELGRFYGLIYYGLLTYITLGVLEMFWPISLAEIGLTVILGYGVLNGGFFMLLETEQSPLFYSLTLITLLAYLSEPPPPPAKNPLLLPVVGLALVGGLSTWQALYPYNSLERWLALVNWMTMFWLLTAVIRRWNQVNRLSAAVLIIAGVVAGSGLVSVFSAASHIGWARALSLRLMLGYTPPNGLAIVAATFLIFSLGLLFIWRKWWQRGLLLALSGLLLALLVLTYSRTGVAGLGVGLMALVIGRIYLQAKTHPGIEIKLKQRWLPLVTILMISSLTVGLVTLGFIGRSAPLNYRALSTLSWRVYLWQVSLQIINQHPWLGVGLNNNFNPMFYHVLSRTDLQPVWRIIATTHNHNLLLEIGVSMGLVGLATTAWLGAAASRYAWQTITNPLLTNPQRWLTITICAAGAAWFTIHLLIMGLSERSLIADSGWLLLALLVIAGREDLDSVQPVAAHPPKRIYLYTWLILAITLLVVVRPLWANTLRRQAETAVPVGDQPAAARLMEQVFWLEPLDAEARAWLGQTSRNPTEAIRLYEQAIALRPYHAPYYDRLGWLYWRQNNLPAALTAFEQAAALDGYDVTGPYHADLSYAYTAAGRKEDALTALQTALLNRLDFIQPPDWPVINADLALSPAYTAPPVAGQVDPSLTVLIDYHLGWGQAAAISTTVAPAFYLGQVLPALTTLTDLPPRTVVQQHANLYIRRQLYERAEAILQQLPSSPSDLQAAANVQRHFIQSYLALQQSHLPQAQAAFEAIRQADMANIAQVHYYLGETYQKQGRLPEALAEFEQTLQLRRALFYVTASEWARMGAAFQQAGQLEPALEAYRLAQFKAGGAVDYAQAQLALNQIYLVQEQPQPILAGSKTVLAGLQAAPVSASAITETTLRPLAAQMAQAYQQAGTPFEAALRQQTQWVIPSTPIGETYLRLFAAAYGASAP